MNLLRKGNIMLPKYQRHFVWEKERVDKLVESIKENLFIPPVTIGSFQEDGKLQNLILDGQQRLTSVLLAYLGLYPNKEHYRRETDYQLAGEAAVYENYFIRFFVLILLDRLFVMLYKEAGKTIV